MKQEDDPRIIEAANEITKLRCRLKEAWDEILLLRNSCNIPQTEQDKNWKNLYLNLNDLYKSQECLKCGQLCCKKEES